MRSISKALTDSQAYVAFNLAEGVGSVAVERLKAAAGSVAEAWENYPKKVSWNGDEVDWESEFAVAGKYGVNIVTPADAEYPKALLEIPGHPLALYVRGDAKLLSRPSIALVGTRRATSYGLSIAKRLAYDLAKAGWSVISGLALGIDAEAHRGALEAGGCTIGVIGSGLDEFYPEANRELAREMVKNGGAVVSEFPFGRTPDRETFPIRNHTVAALSRGTVVIEAPVKSGSLITAGIAADLGRTVMAVPSRVDARMSSGCLKLIRDGAILVRNVDDVLEAFSELFPTKAKERREPASDRDPECPAYSAEEALVMLNVDDGGTTVDELVHKTGLPVETLNSTVMILRIKGFIRFLPGNRISRS